MSTVTLFSRLLEQAFGLPPAQTRDVKVERGLRVPMRDGAVLLADRYAPRGVSGVPPTVLVRSPYGRAGAHTLMYGRPFAERGYGVVIQSCRGTADSGGAFDPFRREHDDGLDTVRWLERQPWFSGDYVTTGPSYLGFVQWALASALAREADLNPEHPAPRPKAMSVQLATSNFRDPVYEGGSFALHTLLRWTRQRETFRNVGGGGTLRALVDVVYGLLGFEERRLRRAFAHLPLSDLDRVVTGHEVGYFQRWLEHDAPDDPWWEGARHGDAVAVVDVPVHLLGGWQDVFLPGLVRDYRALREAGRLTRLTIGPWAHEDRGWPGVAARESLAFFDAHVKDDTMADTGDHAEDGRRELREAPVRLYVTGAEEWREYLDFPPPGGRKERWHLHGGGRLVPDPPSEVSPPDRYRYDPADPTPSVGGPFVARGAGRRDQHALETRADVLLYTSAPLDRDFEAIGPVEAELWVRSGLGHTDFFARLCDVDPEGKSINISDALLRVSPGSPGPEADGTLRLRIGLWPIAHRFREGHCVRLQVSSGAHPRLARNTGSGEPLAAATKISAAEQEVFRDARRPSALVLTTLG